MVSLLPPFVKAGHPQKRFRMTDRLNDARMCQRETLRQAQDKPMTSENESAGHRRRLREKFLKSGLAGFHDYEIIELLLSLGTPRRDCKPQAKEAIKRFKTLRGVLEAPTEELRQIEGIGAHSAFGIKLA